MHYKKRLYKIFRGLLVGFVVLNVLAFIAVWVATSRRVSPYSTTPTRPFTTLKIQSNVQLEAWHLKADSPKGACLLFHGYGSSRVQMLDRAYALLDMGYSVLLVDFMGTGNSAGRQVTIGYLEARNVRDCYRYIAQTGERNIHLLGMSMGAVAIMKALQDYDLKPQTVTLECPYGTMRQAIGIRIRLIGLPSWGLAELMLFWGSVQNGIAGFAHNPVEYAQKQHLPTLLLYGEQDVKVTRGEIDAIFQNLPATKRLVTFPQAGHESYLLKYPQKWKEAVKMHLASPAK